MIRRKRRNPTLPTKGGPRRVPGCFAKTERELPSPHMLHYNIIVLAESPPLLTAPAARISEAETAAKGRPPMHLRDARRRERWYPAATGISPSLSRRLGSVGLGQARPTRSAGLARGSAKTWVAGNRAALALTPGNPQPSSAVSKSRGKVTTGTAGRTPRPVVIRLACPGSHAVPVM